ncbi:hypothetical protein MJG53_019250 [Ovis ammon polii x Ovis aries]|uniref:Uncharacterized protein n=1 Tax=Ovis ammon polii x Ovis aries TaxID=2918886 RepID=A0ACB9U2U6_9CETA|nr:hypothetical protein MJG53_019250 [Ovis ammon polii x Ovis aries]
MSRQNRLVNDDLGYRRGKGLGCGLLYTATVTITCQYFDSRRGLALGLISTGSSVGLFIYAALQRLLIEFYGLDGCLLIVGALALNILACGSLMRPLQSSDLPLPEKTALENVPDRYLIYKEKEKDPEENINMLEKSYSGEETCKNILANGDCKSESLLHKTPATVAHTKETETYKKKVAERTYFCKQLAKRKWQLYKNYCGETVALFKNKVFSALFIAIFLFDIGGFPPSLLMEDVARSSNVKEEEFIMPLISIIGIMTAVGKLILGILADFKWINTLYLYVATLIIMSLALCAIPFAKSYVTLALLSGILGFLTGNWSIFPYVTTKTVGIEKLAHAYGILMFFAGLGNSLGPPIVASRNLAIKELSPDRPMGLEDLALGLLGCAVQVSFNTDYMGYTQSMWLPMNMGPLACQIKQHKYQVIVDGTMAAYRYPYLMLGDSLVLKQDSPYYEHFYMALKPWKHYIPIKRNLSDPVEKVEWAQENDGEAEKTAKEGQLSARDLL